ncbi:Ribosomal protein S18-alanine N-acetyltransferase [[Mycoplasma] cavipharyngis]|uniref:GNAT family N-acetyltransferase n=1 Tax=[Mycoplasma] cavipharyngis TaxID=92757 RepID=UPI003704BB09
MIVVLNQNQWLKLVQSDWYQPIVSQIKDFQQFCCTNYDLILAYQLDDKIVGFITIIKLVDHYEIIWLLVHSEYQNQKIGTKLVQALIQFVQTINSTTKNNYSIWLEVATSNQYAVCLYQKQKFKINRLRKKYFNNQQDAWEMVWNQEKS